MRDPDAGELVVPKVISAVAAAMRRAVALLATFLAVAMGGMSPARPQPTTVSDRGYITMADGTRLRYSLSRPARNDHVPALFLYTPYGTGSDVSSTGLFPVTQFLDAGYAVVGVNLRGSGCSTGTLSLLQASQWGRDGAEVVDWIARQPWSDGNVGMVGASFGGVSQLGTAAFASEHLKAITPFASAADLYREVAYPGGLYDVTFSTEYGAGAQPALSGVGTAQGIPQGDSRCLETAASRQVPAASENLALTAPRHPYFDEYWDRSPAAYLAGIHVPALGCNVWHDGAVGSRTAEIFIGMGLDPATTWFWGANGGHSDVCVPPPVLLRFLDRYVRGIPNGFERTPHITLRQDVSGSGLAAPGKAGWTDTIERWAEAVRPSTLYLHTGGRLDSSSAGSPEAPDRYRYPLPSSSNGVFAVGNQPSGWELQPPPAGSVVYTSPPLEADASFFGPGSADLWLSSTATDTDVQVTLTEVRPDRQEQYVQRGWLRLSHRTLDEQLSTTLRPYHTHQAEDAQPLVPGAPVLARLEIMPFAHVFRPGSRIRLTVDAPTGLTSGIGFDYAKTPAVNTVYHDGKHASRLVLPLIPGQTAGAPLPACGTIDMEPCRPDLRHPAGE